MHFPHTPANQNKKRSADRARGERRVREAREIRGWGFGRNRYERNRILEQPCETDRYACFMRSQFAPVMGSNHDRECDFTSKTPKQLTFSRIYSFSNGTTELSLMVMESMVGDFVFGIGKRVIY